MMKIFKNGVIESTHIMGPSPQRFKCTTCQCEFETNEYMHQSNSRHEIYRVTCPWCEDMVCFTQKKDNENKPMEFMCAACGGRYLTTLYSFRSRFSGRTEYRRWVWQCPECGRRDVEFKVVDWNLYKIIKRVNKSR